MAGDQMSNAELVSMLGDNTEDADASDDEFINAFSAGGDHGDDGGGAAAAGDQMSNEELLLYLGGDDGDNASLEDDAFINAFNAPAAAVVAPPTSPPRDAPATPPPSPPPPPVVAIVTAVRAPPSVTQCPLAAPERPRHVLTESVARLKAGQMAIFCSACKDMIPEKTLIRKVHWAANR